MRRTVFLSVALLFGFIIGNEAQSLLELEPDLIGIGAGEGLSYDLSGYTRAVFYMTVPEDAKKMRFQSIYGETALKIRFKAGSRAMAFTDLRFRSGNEWQNNFFETCIREMYTDIYLGPLDLRAGKQVIKSGKATFFNPEGWLGPIDPTVRSPEEDDMRLGSWALKGDLHPWNPFNLSVVWVPVFTPSVLFTELIPLPDELKFSSPSYPETDPGEGSYNISLDIRSRIADISGSWFEGYSTWPGITFDTILFNLQTYFPEEIVLKQQAYRIRAAGVDLAVPLGSVVFRGEGSWMKCSGDAIPDWAPLPEFSYTGEVEYNGNNISILAGYYGKYIPEFKELTLEPVLFSGGDISELFAGLPQPITPQALSLAISDQLLAFNRLYSYQMYSIYHRAFAAIRLDFFHETVKLDLPVSWDFTSEEYLFRPSLEVIPAEAVSIKAGYSLYGGPENSLYKLISDPLGGAWLQFKVMF